MTRREAARAVRGSAGNSRMIRVHVAVPGASGTLPAFPNILEKSYHRLRLGNHDGAIISGYPAPLAEIGDDAAKGLRGNA